MKKVLFFIPNLMHGGAEKVLVNLVNNLDKNKNEYKEIEKIMEELKLAVIYDNEQLVEKYDEELTDLLFDI